MRRRRQSLPSASRVTIKKERTLRAGAVSRDGDASETRFARVAVGLAVTAANGVVERDASTCELLGACAGCVGLAAVGRRGVAAILVGRTHRSKLAAAGGTRRSALALRDHGDAGSRGHTRIAVRVAVATAHGVELLRARAGNGRASSGLIAGAALGFDREIAKFALFAAHAFETAAGRSGARSFTLAGVQHGDPLERRRASTGIGDVVAAAHRIVDRVTGIRDAGAGSGLIGGTAHAPRREVAEFALGARRGLEATTRGARGRLFTSAGVQDRETLARSFALVRIGLAVASADRRVDVVADLRPRGAHAGLIAFATRRGLDVVQAVFVRGTGSIQQAATDVVARTAGRAGRFAARGAGGRIVASGARRTRFIGRTLVADDDGLAAFWRHRQRREQEHGPEGGPGSVLDLVR